MINAECLTQICQHIWPGSVVRDDPVRLTGGASQETWRFDAQVGQTSQPLILRRRGVAPSDGTQAISLVDEAALIKAVAQSAAPVPAIMHVCEAQDGIGEAYIMARLPGEALAPKILKAPELAHARSVLAWQAGEALAAIHATPVPQTVVLARSGAIDQLLRYREIYDGLGAARPIMELAFAWLAANPPKDIDLCLVHGDFRLGNLLVDAAGLVGVLDWELAHVGDPREDLGWICVNSWRFGRSSRVVGGFGDLGELLDGYAARNGTRFEPAEIDWFQLLGSLKWGVMCLIMHGVYHSGADTSIERAMIGRRASEAEADILVLLEQWA